MRKTTVSVFNWILIIKCVLANPQTQYARDIRNGTCPTTVCDCETDGTIDCGGRNLTAIPSMPEYAKLIFLQDNGIMNIGLTDFSKLNKAQIIDLTNNKIATLNAGIFDNLTDLTTLILHHNMITSVSGEVFHRLRNLTSLDLSCNQITTLPSNIFAGNPSLSRLSLYNNSLPELNVSWFHKNSNWYHMHLSGNPWNCTCKLWRSYQHIIDATRLEIQCNGASNDIQDSMCVTCYDPWIYRSVDLFRLDEFNSSSCADGEAVSGRSDTDISLTTPNRSTGNKTTGDEDTTSNAANGWIYAVLLSVFFALTGIIGLSMWLGSRKERKRKEQSLMYIATQRERKRKIEALRTLRLKAKASSVRFQQKGSLERSETLTTL